MMATIHVIAGPTASGKSAHALALAEQVNSVIINADSMQIYDGLPLLTAQPSKQDKEAHPHALYGTLHPNEDCSAGNWREMVEPLVHDVLNAGKTPIIVGGSGLYINALLYGLSPIPDIPADIRQAANSKQKELGNPAFYALLAERDPVMAERLHADHTARLIRAWEVLEATGKSLAEWQEQDRVLPPSSWEFHIQLIMPERDVLYERCNARFVWMMENNVMAEIEAFDQAIQAGGIKENCILTKALGAAVLRDYSQGKISKEHAIEKAQGQTRQYAKRQVTWFRHQIKENKNIAEIKIIR